MNSCNTDKFLATTIICSLSALNIGSALVFLVEILSRLSNNVKKSFVEKKLCLVTGEK